MKRITFYFGCIILILLHGCGSGGTATNTATGEKQQIVYHINLEGSLKNPSTINLSDIADTICYIELKTPRDMPIGVVDIIEVSEEYIFIGFKGTTYQFTRQGDYLRSIGRRGKGPGEYHSADCIIVDEQSQVINVLSRDMLYFYSFDGRFIGRHTTGDGYSDMVVENSLMYASREALGMDRHRMVMLNQALDTLASIPNYNRYATGGFVTGTSIPFRHAFYRYEEKVYFKGYAQNDTVWHVDDTGCEVHAVIDMGKYKYPEIRNVSDMLEESANFGQKGDYYLVKSVMEDSRFLYLSAEPYWNPAMGSPRVLFDKSQQMGMSAKTASGENGFTEDILGGPGFWPLIISNNDYISMVNADELIEKSRNLSNPSTQFNKFLQSINEDSNPVVIIATKNN